MLTVDDYGRIRRAHRDGMSVRSIARTFHHSRRKIREVLLHRSRGPTRAPRAHRRRSWGRSTPSSMRSWRWTSKEPRKQRHTRAQIYRRLRDEHGYRGGYDAVRRYVGKHQRRQRETFIPLAHDPGQRLECDFGHIYVDFPEGRRQVPVLLTTWAYSYCPFAIAMPTERTEANRENTPRPRL